MINKSIGRRPMLFVVLCISNELWEHIFLFSIDISKANMEKGTYPIKSTRLKGRCDSYPFSYFS